MTQPFAQIGAARISKSGGFAEDVATEAPSPGRPDVTADLTRGVARLFHEMGLAVLPEFTLPTGRRLDLAGLNAKGRIIAAEVKSCRADFEADRKWSGYREYCDAFFFVVDPSFPRHLLPREEGLIVADSFGAAVIRHGRERIMPAARRRSLTLRFARQAALRTAMASGLALRSQSDVRA